ncbi:MAG: hypothetical protein Q9169_003985 [Polycauliona sp. 2 TL-2023]
MARRYIIPHKNTQAQDYGPVDEAVKTGAELHSSDSAIFMDDFNALKTRRMALPNQMFEIVIRAPGKERILAGLNGLLGPSHTTGQLILSVVDDDSFRLLEKIIMYEWLSLLRSRLLSVTADAFVAVISETSFMDSINYEEPLAT